MPLTDVYVGLGGNIGYTPLILNAALHRLRSLDKICHLRSSPFYLTAPVSSIPQEDYVNAVCHFQTSWGAKELLLQLQKIEHLLGKVNKPKNAPRVIDLDILFFGLEIHQNKTLEIPHPRWMERLFVLIPLSNLVKQLVIPDPLCPNGQRLVDILQLIQSFPSPHHHAVKLLNASEKCYVSSTH